MTPLEQFLRHAAECESMAQISRDPESKADWRLMAQRWSQCAERVRQRPVSTVRRKAKSQPQSEAWV
jgi:hypothetical protein